MLQKPEKFENRLLGPTISNQALTTLSRNRGFTKGFTFCRRHWRRGHKLPPYAGGSHAHCFNSLFPPRLVVEILSHVNCRVSHVVPRHLGPNANTAHEA